MPRDCLVARQWMTTTRIWKQQPRQTILHLPISMMSAVRRKVVYFGKGRLGGNKGIAT